MMHPSESVVRRKPGNSYNSGPDSQGYSGPTYAAHDSDPAAHRQHHSHDQQPPPEQMMSSEPEFRHSGVLMLGLAPPLLIMMAFGGRPTLLMVCFGVMVTYIFDLLGAMEVCASCAVIRAVPC